MIDLKTAVAAHATTFVVLVKDVDDQLVSDERFPIEGTGPAATERLERKARIAALRKLTRSSVYGPFETLREGVGAWPISNTLGEPIGTVVIYTA